MLFLKNIKIELVLFFLLMLIAFISNEVDFGFNRFFYEISFGFSNIYLTEFFVKITELGSSSWYFIIIFFFILFFYLIGKIGLFKINNLEEKINFLIASLIYLITAGIVTQVIKHLVGRPRPNHINTETIFGFEFFSFESNYHSFPSGHSSTIFMVCLILCCALPKLKLYFYFLATVIAISRVVVGAHFITDVVAGALLSLMVYKTLNLIFQSKYNQFLITKNNFENISKLAHMLLFLSGICLFLTVAPSLDLFVAGLFYNEQSNFYLQSYHYLSIIFREIILPLILVYLLILPIFNRYVKLDKIFLGYKFSFKELLLIWLSQILVVLIFVNLILKNLWGRARPSDILEFGGSDVFTPWYVISSSCNSNCSFVSGDASVGFSIIVLYFITKKIFFIYLSLFFGLVLGLVRILAGGHYFSDIVFAGIFVVLLNVIIFYFYKKHYE